MHGTGHRPAGRPGAHATARRARRRDGYHEKAGAPGTRRGLAGRPARGITAGRRAGASHATGGTYASNKPGNPGVCARRRRSSLPLPQSADGRVENVPARGRLTWHQRPDRALDRQWRAASCARAADGSGRREPGWHRGACPGPARLHSGAGPARCAGRPARAQSEGVPAHIVSGHPLLSLGAAGPPARLVSRPGRASPGPDRGSTGPVRPCRDPGRRRPGWPPGPCRRRSRSPGRRPGGLPRRPRASSSGGPWRSSGSIGTPRPR